MRKVYQQQTDKAKAEGISNCPYCAIGHDQNAHRIWKLEEMDADHVTAWSKGGKKPSTTVRCSARPTTVQKGIDKKVFQNLEVSVKISTFAAV